MGGAGVLLAAGFGLNTTTTINRNNSTTTTITSTLTTAAPVAAATGSTIDDLNEQMRSCIDGVIAENAPATRRYLAQHIVTAALIKALGKCAGTVTAAVLWPLVYMIVMLRSGGFGQPEPLQAIKLIHNKPVLLIHGTADVLIPWTQAQVLYDAANEPKQLYIVEGATHTATYNADPVAWSKRVLDVVKAVSTSSTSSTNGSRSAAAATVAAVAATAAS
jgi:pimeloyl-ACP methyl ester carboxylesterase